jgi:hypothetical protein
MKFFVYRSNDSLIAQVEADYWSEKGAFIQFFKDSGDGVSNDIVMGVKVSDVSRIETEPKA